MSIPQLSPDQLDALQEITNIGMGQAGDSIARVFGEFIELSVPRVLVVEHREIGATLAHVVGEHEIVAIRQAFHGELHGESVVIFDRRGCSELADLMGHEDADDADQATELLMDVSNVIASACLRGIGVQLDARVGFSAPEPLYGRTRAMHLFGASDSVEHNCALFVDVNFRVERRAFACHLVILLPQAQIEAVCRTIDRLLEAL